MRVAFPRTWFGLAALGAVGLAAACANLDGLSGGSNGPNDGGRDAAVPADGGDGGAALPSGPLAVTPRELAFTFDCAAAKAPQTAELTLRNDTDQGNDFQISLDQSGIFALAETLDAGADGGALSVRVDPRGSRRITVVARERPADTTANAVLHVLAGGDSEDVALSALADGPRLSFDPGVLDFGFVRVNQKSDRVDLTISNTGTKPLGLKGWEPPSTNFAVEGGAAVIPAGGSLRVSALMLGGAAGPTISERATPVVEGTLCGEVPSLNLTGQRVDNDIIVGPGTLDLGDVPCNSTPTATSTITVSNYSTSEIAYTTSAPATAHFTIVSGAAAKIPKAMGTTPSVVTITVKANAPAGVLGTFTEPLSFQFSGTGSPPKPSSASVLVHTRIYGASLYYPDPTQSFGRNTTKTSNIVNSGNQAACVTYALQNNDGTFSVEPDDTIAASGTTTSETVSVTFFALDGQQHNASVTLMSVPCAGASAATPLCKPAPILAVSGHK